MTDNHPIAPPSELVQKWFDQRFKTRQPFITHVANCAAQWGFDQANADIERKLQEAADQELEACCKVLNKHSPSGCWSELLRSNRCPKPPSLKEQALEELDAAILRGDCFSTSIAKDIIRRALKSIPDPS